MIVIDTNERDTRLPTVPGAKFDSDLESLTGADIMVSPLGMPFTEKLLSKHLDAGALLIQRKSGQDFPASIGPRLWESLARMRATGARQWQCVLMTTGWYLPNTSTNSIIIVTPEFHGDGRLTFNTEHYSHANYKAIQSCIRHWGWYGGVYIPLACDDEIPAWLSVTENRLKEKKRGEVKEVWPEGVKMFDPPLKDDPLQELLPVKDWRVTIATFPGVGPTRANALRDAMVATKTTDDLFNALCWASIEKPGECFKVPGWGKGIRKRVRETLGLEDGTDLSIEWREK